MPSHVPDKLSTCQGKTRFASGQFAHKMAEELRRRRKRGERRRGGTNVYRCPCCGGWHIGREHRPDPV